MEDSTICLLALCSELNVWKNSSCKLLLALHELDVVDQQHVDVAIAALELGDGVLVRMPSTYSLRNVSVET